LSKNHFAENIVIIHYEIVKRTPVTCKDKSKEKDVDSISSGKRIASINYIMAALMVMVVMHHALLAPSGYCALINENNNVKAFDFIPCILIIFC